MTINYITNLVAAVGFLFVGFYLIKLYKAIKLTKSNKNTSLIYLSSKKYFNRNVFLGGLVYTFGFIITAVNFVPSFTSNFNAGYFLIVPAMLFYTNTHVISDDYIIINLYKKIKYENISYVKLETNKHSKKYVFIHTKDGYDYKLNGSDAESVLNLYSYLSNINSLVRS